MIVPITMVGRLEDCVLVTLRTPAPGVRGLVPRGLELATLESRGEEWAFWNVVACRVVGMRLWGLPRSVGMSYRHVGYRLMVRSAGTPRVTERAGVEGLYFVRSDADRWLIARLGNLASDFRFEMSEIDLSCDESRVEGHVRSRDGAGDLDLVGCDDARAGLEEGSVFGSLEEARGFCKYRPLGMAPNGAGTRLRLAEAFRDEAQWRERLVRVERFESALLDSLGVVTEVELATRVDQIGYRWRLGRSVHATPVHAADPERSRA